jgi:predicted secreted protein
MKKIALLLCAGLLACSFVAVGPAASQSAPASPPVTQITADQDGQTIQVKAGTTVEITLVENLSTGYGWRTSNVNGTLAMTTIRFTHVGGVIAMPGASGTCIITFTPQSAGTSTFTFEYSRPNGTPAQTFTVTVAAS